MFKLLNKIYIIGALCVAATPAFAKVCFLPDGNCEAGKATYSPTNSITGCEYKDETAAKNGLGECQVVYESGFCHYRRCKMSEAECLKKAHEASHASLGTKLKCVVCKDGCWKLEESKYGPDTEHTCKEQGYKTKENCTADYVKFLPVNLVDKDGKQCGVCKDLECSEMGGYVKKGSCPTGEEFEYADKIDAKGNPCGTCKAKTEPDPDPTPDPTPDNPYEGKTYYVVLSREVKATTNNDAKDCRFTVEGKITYPDVSGDTFMNEVYFGAQIAGYIDYKAIGVSSEEMYQNMAYTIPVQNLMSNVNNYTRTAGYGEPAEAEGNYVCTYEGSMTFNAYSKLRSSKFWVGFNQGQSLYTSDNLYTDSGLYERCKTISKNGSSRTICVKYADQMHYCSYWNLTDLSECEQFDMINTDSEHPTDDYGNSCGTCGPKNYVIAIEDTSYDHYSAGEGYCTDVTREILSDNEDATISISGSIVNELMGTFYNNNWEQTRTRCCEDAYCDKGVFYGGTMQIEVRDTAGNVAYGEVRIPSSTCAEINLTATNGDIYTINCNSML